MERFDEIFTKVCDRLALYVCGGMVLIMMLYVCVHVFSRYVLRIGGVEGTYTYVAVLLAPFLYLGLSYAWYKRGYVVVDMVQARLTGRVHWRFQFAFLLMTLFLFVAWIIYGSFTDTVLSYNSRALVGEMGSPLRTPEWPWKTTIIIGTSLMAIRNILDLVRMVRTGEVISADR